jgi:SAM-dependent methyltransferase
LAQTDRLIPLAGALQRNVGAIFYPSPDYAIRSMLDLAGVNSDSVVYDLGCGNGGIVVAAARDYGARKVVGVEKNKKLCSIAIAKTRGLRNASIVEADYDTVDLSEATVVTLYQSSSENARLKAKFLRELSEGTTIVSHDFGIPGWHSTQFRTFRDHRRSYRVIVYVIGSHSASAQQLGRAGAPSAVVGPTR